MHLDDRYGLAQFIGDVRSEARTDRQMTRLSAQDLRLEFTEAPDFSNANQLRRRR